MIVQASKRVFGLPPVEYYELPAVFPKIYRKMTVRHEIDVYEPVWDGTHSFITGNAFWYSAWNTLVGEMVHPLVNQVNTVRTGSHSGVLCSFTYDLATGGFTTYTLPTADIAVIGPSPINGDYANPDILPTSLPGGFVEQKIMSVSEGSVTSRVRVWFDMVDGILAYELRTTVTQENPWDPESIRDEVNAMLATVPLQKPNQAITGVTGPGGSPVSGYVGFDSTKIAPYKGNLITLFYDVGVVGAPDLTLKAIINQVRSTSDTYCGSACEPLHGRPLSFTPAAMEIELPGGGTGLGVLYTAGQDAGFEYQFRSCSLSRVSAVGAAKKTLLSRQKVDAWTLLRPQDYITKEWEAPVCLGTNITKCLRYYYPAGSDGGGGASADNFSFSGDGVVWREIPLLPPPLPPCCPTGFLDFTNPCL